MKVRKFIAALILVATFGVGIVTPTVVSNVTDSDEPAAWSVNDSAYALGRRFGIGARWVRCGYCG